MGTEIFYFIIGPLAAGFALAFAANKSRKD